MLADIPPERHKARKDFLTDILTFLKSDAVARSGLQGVVWDDASLRNTIKILGEQVGHSLAIAKSRNLPLFSDDVGLRTLGKNEHQITGFCTQAFLRSAVAKGILSAQAYDDALLSLFRHNYNFVSESADTVMRALRNDGYAVTPLTRRLVCRIVEPAISRVVTAGILGHVLADIWLNAGAVLREEWLDLSAQNLAGSEEFPDVCAAVFKTAAVSLLRLPAPFFGLTGAVGRSPHFSSDQQKIWRFLQRATGKAVEKACSVLSAGEPKLKSEWQENIRTSEILF